MFDHLDEMFGGRTLERDPVFPNRYADGTPAPEREPVPSPIFQCGDATYTKQFSRRPWDGQWFYRITDESGRFGRWLECDGKPDYAWYNPKAGKAHLPVY